MNNEHQTFEIKTENGNVNFRTGTLHPPVKSVSLNVDGLINAPAEFFNKKIYGEFAHNDMLVTYDLDSGVVVFQDNVVNDAGSSKITGKLSAFRDLDKLGINQDQKYTTQQLSDKLKMLSSLFSDRTECMKLVSSLRNFSVKIGHDLTEMNDTKGNKASNMVQAVIADFDLYFVLSCQIFAGVQEKKKFKVEIHCDVRDKALELWMESMELKEIMDEEKEKIVRNVLVPFQEAGVPIVQIG
jgi:hypothetical protein